MTVELLLDFHAFPLRIKENPAIRPGDAILQVGFSDGIYNRSKGGVTFSGWKCEHLPYLVELDNYGSQPHAGKARGGIDLGLGLRRDHLVRAPEQSLPRRLAEIRLGLGAEDRPQRLPANARQPHRTSPDIHWYFANNRSPACPGGFGDEDAIRAVWAADKSMPGPQNSSSPASH